MIKCDKEMVKVDGSGLDLLAEIGIIACAIAEPMLEFLPRDVVITMIHRSVDAGISMLQKRENSSSEDEQIIREMFELLKKLGGVHDAN